jgi:hypothetical protein
MLRAHKNRTLLSIKFVAGGLRLDHIEPAGVDVAAVGEVGGRRCRRSTHLRYEALPLAAQGRFRVCAVCGEQAGSKATEEGLRISNIDSVRRNERKIESMKRAMKRVRIIGELSPTDVLKERWGSSEGRTLGEWLALAENGLVPVDDPYCEVRMVSLAPLGGANPNHYLLFKFITLRADRENFDHLDIGDAVVLQDYEVLADSETPEIIRPPIGDGSFLKKYDLPPGREMLS